MVLDAILIVDRPLPPLHVRQTLAADRPYSHTAAAVTGATVVLETPEGIWIYGDDPDSAGRYLPPDGVPVVHAMTRYRLSVDSEGRRASAETVTPERVHIEEAMLLDEETLEVLRPMVTFAETDWEGVFGAPENQVPYLSALPELRFDPVDVSAYQVGILRLDQGSPPVIDLSFLDEESREEIYEQTRFGAQSPPMNIDSGRLKMPWFAIVFGGPHLVRLFAIDENWFDYIRSNGVDTDNRWGGLAGDAFERPIFHVDGGIGLLGSASTDSIGLVILPGGAISKAQNPARELIRTPIP
ncbi:MAG: hypothetical protein CME06_03710 [Gemmatimonadetes bacterium]|nr:hypothetical protein [Gemmatimonadota bacterium]